MTQIEFENLCLCEKVKLPDGTRAKVVMVAKSGQVFVQFDVTEKRGKHFIAVIKHDQYSY